MEGLAGKRALVTGGAAGIGRAIALELARSGCDIALIDVDAGKAETTAARGARAGAQGCRCRRAMCPTRARCARRWRSLPASPSTSSSTMPASAGSAPLLTMSEKDWRETMAINVDGIFNVSRAVVPDMVARKRGAVVNLASWLGRRGQPPFGAYAASKFAVIGLTQALAQEVAASGVRVNAVCPGLIGGTPMRDALDDASEAAGLPRSTERAKAIPMGRAGTPEEVAKVVAFLASDAAAYVSGAAYDVTGSDVDELSCGAISSWHRGGRADMLAVNKTRGSTHERPRQASQAARRGRASPIADRAGLRGPGLLRRRSRPARPAGDLPARRRAREAHPAVQAPRRARRRAPRSARAHGRQARAGAAPARSPWAATRTGSSITRPTARWRRSPSATSSSTP